MNDFKSFGIEPTIKHLSGDKISMPEILGKQIFVLDYKIENSKYEGHSNGKRLVLQFIIDNETRIVFSGSIYLQNVILQMTKMNFPFKTTIIKNNGSHIFS